MLSSYTLRGGRGVGGVKFSLFFFSDGCGCNKE